jgi:Restriction Endonuclease associating with ARP
MLAPSARQPLAAEAVEFTRDHARRSEERYALSSTLDQIIEGQCAWARRRDLAVDDKGRVSLDANLFQALHEDTRKEFEKGAGNELGKDGKPGDMQSLRSSAALACNVFDYWRGRALSPLLNACGADWRSFSVKFEQPFPTGLQGTAPHLDVLLGGPSAVPTAIESKFAEIYQRSHGDSAESYLKTIEIWTGLEHCRDLASQISKERDCFIHLGAAQLLKHALGLQRAHGPRGYRLLYLWYELDGPEAKQHREEIATFRDAIGNDVRFEALTYQDLFEGLEREAPEHEEYLDYLRDRYFA